MPDLLILQSVAEAQEWVVSARREGRHIGSIHTLGALHLGHGHVVRLAASENDDVIVTIFPNPAQLAPGSKYCYDLAADVAVAQASGATVVVAPCEAEMYPPLYRTFLDQGACYQRMDGVVVPLLFRGMITMSFRWINALRPQRTYWGLKDIGQTLLVTRALDDFMVPVEMRRVPCVRAYSGVPVSSRLMGLDKLALADVRSLYKALWSGLELARQGPVSRADVCAAMYCNWRENSAGAFTLRYLDCFDPIEFSNPDIVKPPFILHAAISAGQLNHFDGLLIETEQDLMAGPPVHWVDDASLSDGRRS